MTTNLPARPDLGHLKRQAKNLLKVHQRGDADACLIFRRLNRFNHASDAHILASEVKLNEVQFALALDYGFSSWDSLKRHVEQLAIADEGVNPHELLCRTNWELIEGKRFSDGQKAEITAILLASADEGNAAAKSPDIYPLYFTPPGNDRKLITINGVTPKTQIFSANHYELEILRLLALWRPNDNTVRRMLFKTKERLSKTCFGKFCATGECFEASIVALRFLATAFPDEEEWIGTLTENIRDEIDNKPKGKRRRWGTTFYYWLTLTDVQVPTAISEIRRYEALLVRHLSRSYSYQNAYDRVYNPIAKYIVRNCLARLPEYQHIRGIEGHEGNDGRFHFDFARP